VELNHKLTALRGQGKDLAVEERARDLPEDPDDADDDQVRPDHAKHIKDRREAEAEVRREEGLESGSSDRQHSDICVEDG